MIQSLRSHHLLNSKAEFNRSAVPRLGLKMGDREYKDRKKEEENEQKKEETLEMKIRELRKERQKGRKVSRLNGQPARKRQRRDENLTTPRKNGDELPRDEGTRNDKRKLPTGDENPTPSKMPRRQTRIMEHFSSKKLPPPIDDNPDDQNCQ